MNWFLSQLLERHCVRNELNLIPTSKTWYFRILKICFNFTNFRMWYHNTRLWNNTEKIPAVHWTNKASNLSANKVENDLKLISIFFICYKLIQVITFTFVYCDYVQFSYGTIYQQKWFSNILRILTLFPSVYLARLIFEMPQSRTTKFMETVILTLYNYASNHREEYLLLKLFKTALKEEIRWGVDHLRLVPWYH